MLETQLEFIQFVCKQSQKRQEIGNFVGDDEPVTSPLQSLYRAFCRDESKNMQRSFPLRKKQCLQVVKSALQVKKCECFARVGWQTRIPQQLMKLLMAFSC